MKIKICGKSFTYVGEVEIEDLEGNIEQGWLYKEKHGCELIACTFYGNIMTNIKRGR